ncbi:DNA polymerase [Crossiella sp. CA198]|uniref:DNA polymerase n=1 Tax=Crossiella sp. CA198 TaxID=3455607 RepID=UPI003F8CF420
MRILNHTMAGAPVEVRVLEGRGDSAELLNFCTHTPVLAMDTETTGLDIYAANFRIRTVQFGHADLAYVVPVEYGFGDLATEGLRRSRTLVCHNAPFDLLSLDRTGLADFEKLAPRVRDTRLMAHQLDSRAQGEGGIGHGLKDLAEALIDDQAPDTQTGLHQVFRQLGLRVSEGFAQIDLAHPVYLLYAGLDVILTHRLHTVLTAEIQRRQVAQLVDFDHQVQQATSRMQRRGMLLDVEYTERLVVELRDDAEAARREAAQWGVTKVGSPAQVAEALIAMGEELAERTAGGAWKVDKQVLGGLADPGRGRGANPLAAAVLAAKRADKWRTSYAEAMLANRDSHDRIHPTINALQARTARMSVSNPPLQQLPSRDWRIRQCILAEPGHVILSADFASVELRVLAALADEQAMKSLIQNGVDLHDSTAAALFGPNFTKAQRQLAKAIAFGKVYGGGAAGIARQTGVELSIVERAVAGFDRTYPAISRLSHRLRDRVRLTGERWVTTPTGRRIHLDSDRLYAATNYLIQPTARDIAAQALLAIEDAGYGEFLRMVIHDEFLASVPAVDAEEIGHGITQAMSMTLRGVPIDADFEVGGRSWGSLYGAPATGHFFAQTHKVATHSSGSVEAPTEPHGEGGAAS